MSSTLLQKAQQALNEKTTKIIPENIKKNVTVFGVTGTYEGSGGGGAGLGIRKIYNGRKAVFYGHNLATLLNRKVTTEQKTWQLCKDGETRFPAMSISCGFINEGSMLYEPNFGFPVNIDFKYLEDGLVLSYGVGDNTIEIAEIDDADSETKDYYKNIMTIGDFIDLVDAIGSVDLTCVGPSFHCYDVISIRLNTEEDHESSHVLYLDNIQNTFLDLTPQEYEISSGYDIWFDSPTLASYLDENLTEAEKNSYVSSPSSNDYDPAIVLANIEYEASSDLWLESELSICLIEGSTLALVAQNSGSTNWIQVFLSDVIASETTSHDWSNPLTFRELISILKSATGRSYTATKGLKIKLPLAEIQVKGITLDKTITNGAEFENIITTF